jgi:protein arginine N-methyltransferase 1
MAATTTYSIVSYGGMVASEPRMSAYAEALRRAVTPGCTVIDIGAGPGVFSLLACQYGAGSVIAIEPDDSVELLRQMAKDNGCSDRITIVQGLSTEFTPPSRADVIISDIRGCLPLFEGHIPTIIDARERMLAPGGTLIPARDKLRVALAQSSEDYASYEVPWARNGLGLNLAGGQRFAVNCWWKVKLGADALLSDPADVAVLDYYHISNPDFAAEAELQANRSGTAHGLLVWFDAELAPGVGFSNAPGEPPLIYGQTFLPLQRPMDVSPGDRISIELTANLIEGSYVWGWNTSFHGEGKAATESFRQSTFLGKVMSPQSLKSRSNQFVPPSSDRHAVDRLCLSLIDGKRSLGIIAAELRASFPDRFESVAQALNHVASLTARYR